MTLDMHFNLILMTPHMLYQLENLLLHVLSSDVQQFTGEPRSAFACLPGKLFGISQKPRGC